MNKFQTKRKKPSISESSDTEEDENTQPQVKRLLKQILFILIKQIKVSKKFQDPTKARPSRKSTRMKLRQAAKRQAENLKSNEEHEGDQRRRRSLRPKWAKMV
jgi:hypothetical protein